MTEIELLHKYSSTTSNVQNISKIFNVLCLFTEHGINNEILDTIDTLSLKEKMNEFVNFMGILKRFNKLHDLFKGGLIYDNTCTHFIVSGHEFSTLDEVERAWNNRALL